MGNICNSTIEDQTIKDIDSTIQLKVRIRNIPLEVIHCDYKSIRAESLVLILESTHLKYNPLLQHALNNEREILQEIDATKKIVEIAEPSKHLAVKKVVLCCMPLYDSVTTEDYQSYLVRILNEVFLNSKELLFVFSQTSEQHTLPNQVVISLILEYIATMEPKRVVKVKLASEDRNICNLCRLQIMKGSVDSKGDGRQTVYQYQRLKINDLEPSIYY